MKEKLLEVKNLSVAFKYNGKYLPQTRDVSFDIYKGEILGLVGESGSGKSVTSKMLLQLLPATGSKILSGQALFEGEDLIQYPRKKMYNIRGNKGIMKKEVATVKAVDGVSFEIRKGETFGLVGESGCGKTTVGKLILRLLDATEGEVIFDGRDLQALSKTEMREMRKEIQIIFQDPYGSLNPRMTVYEIIAEPIRKHKLASGEEVTRRVAELLNRVGLSEREMRKYPHEFSGGQRQRICIARALAVNPRLIVCDEPVSALDVSVQSQILNLLKDLQRDLGVAYLFIAHGMPAVRHMSDRVGVMYLGSLVEVADCKELFSNQLHPYSKALISAIPVADPDHKPNRIVLEGDVPNPISLNPGCRFYSRCPVACERCKNDPPALREVLPGHYVACHLVEAE